MRSRMLAVVWFAIGVAVWCGFFDLYVSRGARRYLQEQAEYQLHMIPREPVMAVVMDEAKHAGIIAASLWASAVVFAGWATIWLRGGTRSRSSRGSL